MVFETLADALVITVPTAVAISGLSILAEEGKKWDWRKFAYTAGIATFAGIALIESQFASTVTAENILAVIAAIAGASFLGNKAIIIASRLKK